MVTDEIGSVRTVAGLCDFKGLFQSKRFHVASIKQSKKYITIKLFFFKFAKRLLSIQKALFSADCLAQEAFDMILWLMFLHSK